MGLTLLQIGRVFMMAFWFTFILVALNMALDAWNTAPNWLTAALFVVAAYAGLGMLIGMAIRFQATQRYMRHGF